MFNPIKASENIKEEFVDYIKTTFTFSDESLQTQFGNELSSFVSKGPFLEIGNAFRKGKSIRELIEEGVLSPLFEHLEPLRAGKRPILPLNRCLYLHQENAIRKIVAGENVVISTGTGSGKTNCFLIPVLNELLREKEEGTLGPGIRALFIYPMNALANDQLKNLRKILMDYPDITFGVYNGGTEYKDEEAERVYRAMFLTEEEEKLRKPLPNELLSRASMKENPPQILFTNYSMLEHLLFRPNDDVLFSRADFRFVVLDEAHIYSGSTGIETSILLRRLKARIASKGHTQFILTSATLGKGEEANQDILRFAENLCGVSFRRENIIRALRVPDSEKKGGDVVLLSLFRNLAREDADITSVLISNGITPVGKDDKEILYNFLSETLLYHSMKEAYRKSQEGILSLTELQKRLRISKEDLSAFLTLCIQAQKEGTKLLDARFHYFIRCLEGVYVTLGKEKYLTLVRQESLKGDTLFEVALCQDCGHYAIVGKIENGKLVKCAGAFESADYFFLESDCEEEEAEEESEHYLLCPHCGAIKEEGDSFLCDCEESDYIHLVKAKKTKSGKVRCLNCHQGMMNRFLLGSDAATSVLATALYEELPELEKRESDKQKVTTIFGKTVVLKPEQKKAIRQFLVFSDSRQEAAKFACYLSKSYEEFLRRRGITAVLSRQKERIQAGDYMIPDLVSDLENYFSANRTFVSSLKDPNVLSSVSRRNAWVAVLNELVRSSSPTSLTSLGILCFEYLGNDKAIIKTAAESYGVSEEKMKSLFSLLTLEIIRAGSIVPNDNYDLSDDDKEYIFYSSCQSYLIKEKGSADASYLSAWMPRNRGNGTYFNCNRLRYVKEFLSCDDNAAIEFMSAYFEFMTSAEMNPYAMVDRNKDKIYVLQASSFRVCIPGNEGIHWYRCRKCHRIANITNDGRCTMPRCNGIMDEIDASTLFNGNHYANLYYSNKMDPLLIKEHTAQLSRKESADYQEQFIKKEINALSCSTTFEMGVDVGSLETVLLRDVPPLPSNYAQRAGRAGRSLDSAAYCLTYAKRSSHDLTYFNRPLGMIDGVIQPPLFKVDNEKIVLRHVYDIALSMYFRDHPEQYDRNKIGEFIDNKGYLEFGEWLRSKPERLRVLLKESIPNIDDLHHRLGIDDDSWIEQLIGEKGTLTLLIQEYEENVSTFEALLKKCKRTDDFKGATQIERKLNDYRNNQLIDFLARGNILPRYGFPVDVVELEQNTNEAELSKLRLTRDLSVAIAEYAPSSEVVANGKLYTSRYIKKARTSTEGNGFRIAYLGECSNPSCGATQFSATPIPEEGVPCTSCGELLHDYDFKESIEPVSGFVTEREAKEVPFTGQERNYKSEDIYIGSLTSKQIKHHRFSFHGVIVDMESRMDDSLLVKSTHGFYVCPECGYSFSEEDNLFGDEKTRKAIENQAMEVTMPKRHKGPFGNYDCHNKTLKRFDLHHIFTTDVTMLTFGSDCSDYSKMISSMYALLYAICDTLTIERKDLKACLSPKVIDGKLQYSIVFYDAVPSGAGHSRRLVTEDGLLFQKVIQVAKKNMESCQCEPSCYNCLRSYENQKVHDKLDRRKASEFLSLLIGGVERLDESDETEEIKPD